LFSQDGSGCHSKADFSTQFPTDIGQLVSAWNESTDAPSKVTIDPSNPGNAKSEDGNLILGLDSKTASIYSFGERLQPCATLFRLFRPEKNDQQLVDLINQVVKGYAVEERDLRFTAGGSRNDGSCFVNRIAN
jgi:hypothetical protein